MIEITRIKIENWASVLKIENLILAEHDYRILFLLKDIYSHPFLSNRLCLKGGTAINKLFLKETSRLSIDLDFNIIGEKEQVFKERKEIKGKLIEMLRRQKMEKIEVKSRYEELTVSGRYKPIFGEKQKIKLEISYIERIPILDPVEKEMKIPLGKIRVKTYRIEELLATKIRALYDRVNYLP
ncbi:MAG: nucleotidyl transferase AbiEii/AbiGii toxin family protein [Candidatus Aenigmarchaeota archaeon]|nr:nucleotidyl transferase AbiEii/AbiGii toxin family protein [Candidatus Aenigmarchaeota archaeon]